MEDASVQDKLSMIGKKALLQTDRGLYYGTLEKADTRYCTALMTDVWEVPREYALDEISAKNLVHKYKAAADSSGDVRVKKGVFSACPKGSLTGLAAEGIVVASPEENSPACGKAALLSLTGVTAVAPITDERVLRSFERPYTLTADGMSGLGIMILSGNQVDD
jgi:hypothetical protein